MQTTYSPYAISVHKCQGMTLDHIETNLSRVFDHGMLYVACSRVTFYQGLHVSSPLFTQE